MSSSSAAAGGSRVEISRLDQDVAGRTRHRPLARALERLIVRLRKVEQPRPRRGVGLDHARAVGGDEADLDGHASGPRGVVTPL